MNLFSLVDVATDNLLDFDDGVNVEVETNGNTEEEQLDNHRPSETNNNPAWVRRSSGSSLALCFTDGPVRQMHLSEMFFSLVLRSI